MILWYGSLKKGKGFLQLPNNPRLLGLISRER
jgi:hypothetical protein